MVRRAWSTARSECPARRRTAKRLLSAATSLWLLMRSFFYRHRVRTRSYLPVCERIRLRVFHRVLNVVAYQLSDVAPRDVNVGKGRLSD